MDERTADEAFRRYQATGEPEDLAWVFDRLAGRLLLVAAHLAPDGPTAEDLVQGTFLEAMRNAPAWDGERPLIGWLVGILRNLAAARHRRGARQRALPEEALVAPVPTDDFEQQEMLARVQAIIEDLPAPYREVLLLHLIQGLGPKAIAHSLDRAQGTVRMQIHRGLQRLRETLPAGTLPALFGLHLPSDRWPALRADLLQQAAAHQASIARTGAGVSHSSVPAPVPALTIGALLMGHKLLLSSILILAVALAVWNWKSATPGAGLAASGPMEVSLPANLQGDFPLRSADTSPSGRQVAAPDPSPSGPSTAEDRYSLDAKLVRAGDRMPLFGVQLAVLVPGSAAPIRRALTDEQGRVTWQELPAGTYRVRVDRSPVEFEVLVPAAGPCIFELPAGTRVLGTVVNAKGQPVAFADVESIAAAEWSTEAVVAHCDEQGRFTLENAAHLLLLRARAHGYQPGLADFVLAEGPPSFELELVLGAPASTLRGQVLRPAGLPAAGAEVLIAFPSGEDEPASLPKHTTPTPQPLDLVSVRCDSEGRFASDEIPEGPLLLFATSDEGPESVWQEYWLQGTGQVSLTLGPAGRLRLEVEGQGGAPLPSDVQLRLLWMGSDTLGPFWPGAAAALRHRRPLRGAMAEFDGLLPGRYQVQVERCPDPTAPWSQCWYSGEVDVLAGEVTSQRIQLRVPERIEVHMTDEAGEPLAGWTVAAVAAGDSEIDPAAPPAVLDEHGRAVLFAASGTESGELLLIAPGGVSTARWRGHWSKGQPDPIAPPRESDLPRASLRGRLPWATPPSSGELLLEYEGDASARQLPLDEQGRFAADYLPAGSFQLLWEDADAETSIPIAVGTLSGRQVLELGDLPEPNRTE